MSDEISDFQSNGEPGTDEEPTPAEGVGFISDITSMYTYLNSLERPSLANEDLILEMEKVINAWLKQAQKEGWDDIIQDNLLDAAFTVSSLSWYIYSESSNRPPEFYKNLNVLKTALYLLLDDGSEVTT